MWPKVIPPRSVVRLVHVTSDTPGWKHDRGREFRIGYYSAQDGLDCVWLVNENGEYEQTVDQATLQTHFEVVRLARESDLFGARKRRLPALARRHAGILRLPRPTREEESPRRTGTA